MRRILFALVLLLSLLIVGCGAQAPAENTTGQTDEPTAEAVEPTEEVAMEPTEAPTEEVAVEPTEEVMEMPEMPDITGMGALEQKDGLLFLDAGGCEYGGYFSRIEATDANTVVFTMCKPDPAFEAKVAFEGFGIHSMDHLIATGGTGDILEQAIGTGPYQLDSWNRGESVILTANENYWGDAPRDATMVIRWATEGAARLLELQSGQVDQIFSVGAEDFETIAGDDTLKLIPAANPNVFYLGMTNTFEPFTNQQVRQAIAMGIDRQRIVDNFYPEGSTVPDFFTPCSIPGGCEGDPWYEFDLAAAKELLAEAGFADGFETRIYYRDVARGYLPEPALVAVELQTQLAENLGITAEIMPMESGPFLEESSAGNLDGFYLLGWGADYPHPTNFLDYHFSEANAQFGDPFAEIFEPLTEAAQLADASASAELYAEANNAIREFVPMIPIANGAGADAALADADGAHTRPFGAVIGSLVDTPDDTFVYMQGAEPISLYCVDETDGETFRVCGQIFESLLAYGLDSGDTEPALATACEGNDDATEWTCKLREGVTYHDGSTFDANDVVMTYAVGLDASNPLHIGNSGAFEYWAYLWGLMNAPAAE